jgi:hypothetical protein
LFPPFQTVPTDYDIATQSDDDMEGDAGGEEEGDWTRFGFVFYF